MTTLVFVERPQEDHPHAVVVVSRVDENATPGSEDRKVEVGRLHAGERVSVHLWGGTHLQLDEKPIKK